MPTGPTGPIMLRMSVPSKLLGCISRSKVTWTPVTIVHSLLARPACTWRCSAIDSFTT